MRQNSHREQSATLDSFCDRVLTREGVPVAYLLGVPVAENTDEVLVFEVDRSEVSSDLVLASDDPDRLADRARVSLEQALRKLKPSLQNVLHMLREMSPEETEVEFGLKIGGEAGVIVAKGTAEASFTVRMSWKSEQRGVAR